MTAPLSRETLERFAKNSKLLGLLDSDGLTRLAACGTLETHEAGYVVVKQGDLGETFYLIAEGEVRVLVAEAGDKEVARLAAGMFFGEMAVVTRQPRSATVETTVPTQLVRFAREPVVHILRDYPKVREFLGSVGLERTEANISHMLDSEADEDDLGLPLPPPGELELPPVEESTPSLELDTDAPAPPPLLELDLDPGPAGVAPLDIDTLAAPGTPPAIALDDAPEQPEPTVISRVPQPAPPPAAVAPPAAAKPPVVHNFPPPPAKGKKP